ncbi:MAG: exosortase system-associated protein, TIGR04073 family [Candidatus Omnitrophica bacterium]|nr:exosortase system-associated protein, TIGR04073 family [Candidatus Omnitrophota bacterium]
MARRKTWIWLLCAGVMAVWMTAPAMAEEKPSYPNGAIRKLGRGLANIATCPAELIRMPTLVGRQDGNIAALSVGLLQGIWRTALRGIAGAYEVGTFLVPLPRDFKPVLMPEFVYAHGDWTE